MSKGMEAALWAVKRGIIRVDRQGRVWRHKTHRNGVDTPIKPRRIECKLKSGYLGVCIRYQGKQRCCAAHRLVWTVLRSKIPKYLEINHKNGIKDDNRPNNMELMTHSQNIIHAYENGLIGMAA